MVHKSADHNDLNVIMIIVLIDLQFFLNQTRYG